MKKYIFYGVVIFLYIFVSINFAQDSKSLLNQPAPNLVFEKIINYEKTTAQSSDFRPKVLIIDFWATWCAPCIASLPHLEEIQNKYGEKVQIITVTDETEERIKTFLSKKKLSLPVVIDPKEIIAETFPFRTLPHTIIIDSQNIVRAVTTSSKITNEILDKIIANQTVALEEKKDDFSFDPSKPLTGKENFLYQATFSPYRKGLPAMANSFNIGNSVYLNRRILAVNVGLKELYEIAYQYPTYIRTIIEVKDKTAFKWSEQNAYCYDLIVPEEIGSKRFLIMQQQLETMFPYKVFIEKRNMPIKVLRKIKGANSTLKVSAGGEPLLKISGKELLMKNKPIKSIADFIQTVMNKIAVDETGIDGNYDLNIPFYLEDPNRFNEELNKIGLELVDENRAIEMLIISDR